LRTIGGFSTAEMVLKRTKSKFALCEKHLINWGGNVGVEKLSGEVREAGCGRNRKKTNDAFRFSFVFRFVLGFLCQTASWVVKYIFSYIFVCDIAVYALDAKPLKATKDQQQFKCGIESE
jgi:hypothetical protein